jgi:Cu(I)/Ag(I) efflux system membrane fusion protein
MTMDFKNPAAGLPKNITKGGSVVFEFKQRKDGEFELTAIAPSIQIAPAVKAFTK